LGGIHTTQFAKQSVLAQGSEARLKIGIE